VKQVEADVVALLDAYHSAMVGARTADLDPLLDEGFSLVHITGYVQPKEEWFSVIRSGEFDYHQIDFQAGTLALEMRAGETVLTGKGIFDATIYGMRSNWRLRFAIRLAKQDDRWRILHAHYTRF
jgi:hypothetical protein